MAVAAQPKRNLWQRLVLWFKELIESIEERFEDPALTRMILEDLGLPESAAKGPPPDAPVRKPDFPGDKKDKLDDFLREVDPDEASLGEVILEVTALYEAYRVFHETLEDEEMSAWEMFWLLTRVWVVESLRVRNPAGYAVCKALNMVVGEYDSVEQFDPAIVVSTLKGEPLPADYGERLAQRWSALFGTLAVATETWMQKVTHDRSPFEAFYGWDPDPDSLTPQADLVSQRTGTMLLRFPGTPSVTVGLSTAAVPAVHGGPGLFVGVSGELSYMVRSGGLEWTAAFSAPGGTWFYINLPGSEMKFDAGGPARAAVRVSVRQVLADPPGTRPPAGTAIPPLVIGDTKGTHLELSGFEGALEVNTTGAEVRVLVAEGRLVAAFGGGDGFLAALPGGRLEVPFSLGVSLDTTHGLRIDGGTRLRANLAVSASVFGVFTLQYLELATGPTPGGDLGIELVAGASLYLGPFQASIDRVGLRLDTGGVAEGDLRSLTRTIGFKPPSGVGLLLDAGVVKGGGYLGADHARGEYFGALELTVEKVPIVGSLSVKAIGILTTKMPDGGDGWSLLLMVFAQFRVQLGWGFTFNGLGGIVGLHHRPDPQALSDGLRTGVIDDLLFPENPIADAPRIIPRLRTVFPIERGTFTVGLAVELGYGTPTIAHLRLALLWEVDHALDDAQPRSLSKIVLLGQLLVQLPPRDLDAPPVFKLLIDIIGWYDYDEDWLFFRARLRDSKVAGFALTGELVVSMESGEDPSFIFAAGGFHPSFVDVPRGVPATMDRLGFGLELGPVKMEVKAYYAITPNAKHLGLNVELKAKLGPVSIEGLLGFDALVDDVTDRFIAQVRFAVALKFRGHTLCGVTVNMELEGPGAWHAVGTGSFGILWWDYDFDFDERCGEVSPPDAAPIRLRQDLASELTRVDNWSARLPTGTESPVTVVAPPGDLVAHPLGQVAFLQRRVPLGIEVRRVGGRPISGGPVTFSFAPPTVGGATATSSPLTEHFARGQFVDLTEEQKLVSPTFERFDAGIAVGTPGFLTPSAAAAVGRAPLAFEDRYLTPEDEPHPHPDPRRRRWLVSSLATASRLDLTTARRQSQLGSSGRSHRRLAERLLGTADRRFSVADPPLLVVDEVRMTAVAGVDGRAVATTTAAEHAVATHPGTLLVEAFEVVG